VELISGDFLFPDGQTPSVVRMLVDRFVARSVEIHLETRLVYVEANSSVTEELVRVRVFLSAPLVVIEGDEFGERRS